jgi:hypothetical protein
MIHARPGGRNAGAVQTSLEPATFAAAFAAGQQMTLEEAFAMVTAIH